MARMYPEDIEGLEEATEGEKRLFRFLREAARPQRDFICWYQPSIGRTGREPDFVLFCRKLGLLVLEVKDWTSRQIVSYTPRKFTVRISGRAEEKTNPLKQARGAVLELMEKFRAFPEFLSEEPLHEGELKIPIGRMAVFPNIRRSQYLDRGLQWLIPQESALLEDDLKAAGEILCDNSGRKFHDRIAGAFPFPFRGLTEKETERLCFLIWPVSRIDLPPRRGEGKSRFQREVQALDEAQARLALRLKPGHQIIKGPPGSGKTVVLVHRCCHLHRYHPGMRKILLVCFNIALVGYLKRSILEKGIGTGEHGVEVYHFFELCSRVLGETVHYENEDSEYYDLVAQEALERIGKGEGRAGPYDAILADEGQDFDNRMLRVLLGLLRPGGDLVVALDSFQDLYMRRPSWSELGIRASGRATYLRQVYRNTKEIFDFTQAFIGRKPGMKRQLALLPDEAPLHGEPPEIRRVESAEDLETFLARDMRSCIEEGYRRSEIAVLYDDKVYGPSRFAYDNRALPMRLLKKLDASGIPAFWVSQDVRSKQMFDVTTDRVSVISIHSSKGLDFDLVYLVGVDHIHVAESAKETLTALIYVGMTRAKYRLVIPYVQETELVRRMKACLNQDRDKP
ncbi:MAG: NERD domain-containing protein [Deltaproteobacteria bacterium]|nr:NERD domain-containing protein [Deltaproteobacteria bacterium]